MALKKDKKTVAEPDRNELAQLIADSLNKMNKDSAQVAYFLDGSETTPTDFTDFVSVGSTKLDIAISNRPHGGIAVGRITELTGLEASGKSLVSAHILASAQKAGGIGVLIDTEISTNKEFLRAIGVDTKALVYSNLETVEDIFDAIVTIIENVRTSANKDKLVVIVVDSVAAASTKQEMEADFSKAGYATGKAIIISMAMRKITQMIGRQRIALVFTNQLRQKMNAMPFSDPWTTSGGKAIAFHASTRLRLAQVKKITVDGVVVGIKVKAVVVKNRLGPPHRTAEFDIYFNKGIDDVGSWLDMLKESKLLKQAGAWYTYSEDGKPDERFQKADFAEFLERDPARKEALYAQICESLIMKYGEEIDPQNITFEDPNEDE